MNNPFEKKKSELEEREIAILREARKISGKPHLKITDILEWSANKLEEEDNTKIYFLNDLKVYVKVEE